MLGNKRVKVALIEFVGGHGGLEIYDLGVCNALVDCGFDVSFYTCSKTKGFEFESKFKINRFFGKMFANANSYFRFLSYLKGIISTVISINKNKTDIVYLHVFTFSLVELITLLATFAMRAKVVVNIHDPISLGGSSNKLLKPIYIRIVRYKKILVTTHTEYSKQIIQNIFPSLSVSIMPYSDIDFIYGVPKSSSECRLELGIDNEGLYVLFFGQIKKTKGLDVLLNAWDRVVAKVPNVKLLVVGRCWGDESTRYRDIIREKGIESSVVWEESYIEDEDVPRYFYATDLVILPYTRIYSSAVVLRSMGYGKPVMVSDQPAFTGIIEKNKSGFVFKSGCAESLSNELIAALSSKSLRDNVANEASAVLNHRYSWKVVGSGMSLLFHEHLNNNCISRGYR